MRRTVALLLTFAVALGATPVSAAPGPVRPATGPATASNNGACLDTEERAFLTLINDYRRQNGLGTLQASHKADGAADFHSSEMADYNYFSHTLRGGVSWSQNMSNFGYTANTYRGENIAAGNSTASATFDQWKNSPAHNANMLSANYAVIGIGRAFNASSTYDWYWTTDFGGYVYSGDAGVNCAGSPAPTPTPTRTPTAAPTPTRTPTAPAGGAAHTIVGGGRTTGSSSSTNAYDKNTGSTWYSYWASPPPASAYVWFDLGGTKSVGSVQWLFGTTGLADSMKIQVSTDRSTWTTLATKGNSPAGVWQTLATTGTSARYVRFYFSNPSGDNQLGSLAEVKITT